MSSEVDLTQWVEGLSDTQLVALLTARPDLASPPPANTAVLVSRMLSSVSSQRAALGLDSLALHVLEEILLQCVEDPDTSVTATSVTAAFIGRAPRAAVIERISTLRQVCLIWGPDRALHAHPSAQGALPWAAGQVRAPVLQWSKDELQERIDGLDDEQRRVLTTLAQGHPVGRTKDAAPDAPADNPIPQLIAGGLLTAIDDQTVELPGIVGRAVRGEYFSSPRHLDRPPLSARTVDDADAAAGGEVIELIRHCTDVLTALGYAPAVTIRTGGLGVRELRRIAKSTGLPTPRVSFILELLKAAQLIHYGMVDPADLAPDDQAAYAPTPAADGWFHVSPAKQWHQLASAWLKVGRRLWLAGDRNRDGAIIAPLSEELRAPGADSERRIVLEVLASLPEGTAPSLEELSEQLSWSHPLWARRIPTDILGHIVTEATSVGLIARQSISTPGRLIIVDDGEAVTTAMDNALPTPINYFLLQADLTLTAPGPLEVDLARQISLVADLEHAGAASVFRITESSLYRALDAGLSTTQIHNLFATHSTTPVPQSLTYLVDDVARRHGQLRVGLASAFVRCEDPALLAQVIASSAGSELALRALAPTVAISQASLSEILAALRSAGFNPTGENSSGDIIDLRPPSARVAVSSPPRSRATASSPPQDEVLASIVARMRAHDTALASTTGAETSAVSSSGTAAMRLLQLATRVRRQVRVGYVDAHGRASTHILSPLTISAGQLEATEEGVPGVQKFTVHRITSVGLMS